MFEISVLTETWLEASEWREKGGEREREQARGNFKQPPSQGG